MCNTSRYRITDSQGKGKWVYYPYHIMLLSKIITPLVALFKINFRHNTDTDVAGGRSMTARERCGNADINKAKEKAVVTGSKS